MNIETDVLDKVRDIVTVPGWTAEPVRLLFTGTGAGVRLLAGPQGQGRPRAKYLIVADTLPDAFRCLGECLEMIGEKVPR